MTNPFSDLQTAVSNATGIDFALSGIILGACLTVTLIVIFEVIFTFGKSGSNSSKHGESMFLLSGGIGTIISFAVGWFPVYIPIFIGLIIAFIVIDPFGKTK